MNLKHFLWIPIVCIVLYGHDRGSSAPYISGDGFRSYADFVIDFHKYGDWHRYDEINRAGEAFNPAHVRSGDVIFVNTQLLSYFFDKYHRLINYPYILLTHNNDFNIPGIYANYLEDKKIIEWFGQNVALFHPKLYPLPIGLANKYWPHGNPGVIVRMQSRLSTLEKDKLAYLNINIHTNPKLRSEVVAFFAQQPFCTKAYGRSFEDYLGDLASSKFVLSPQGNGLDCHRTWETLLMGSFPIVKSSAHDNMFADLPVLIVNDWQEVTQDFLERKYTQMCGQSYNFNKLYLNYWITCIEQIKFHYQIY